MDAPLPFEDRPPGADGPTGARPALKLVVSTEAAAIDPARQLNDWTLDVALRQDRAAFSALFRHFAPRMNGWLWKTGSSPEEAQEIVQDAFVVLWRKAAQFDPARADVGSWLFTIARNLRIDRRRAIHDTWTSLDDFEIESIGSPEPGQEDTLLRRQHDERVRSAISRLTPEQRTLVQLSFYEDMSHSKIAAELKVPLGTVKTRLRRAAACLRALLEECRP
ncbi:MAG: sigma-70 family RNA polymerase sigma factor [Burkholderiaceae bacterium]